MGWTICTMGAGKTPQESLTPIDMGHLATSKANKKSAVRAADDNFERARTIARELHRVVVAYKPRVICAEALSFVRSAQTMCKIGMCFGVVADLVVTCGDIPFLQATPQEIKKALCGNNKASKADIEATLDDWFQNAPRKHLDALGLAKSYREHPYDSLGAIVACWESDPMRLARQFSC